jgi:periplasmic protein TonB
MKTLKWIFYPVFILCVFFFQSVNAQDNGKSETVYTNVDELPEFPGGIDALKTFVMKEIVYPSEAKKEGIQGKVFVSFTVNKKGAVTDANIAKGVHGLLDKEALRVIENMPAWTPGKHKGEIVNVRFTVPIQFALSSDK